MTQSMHIKLGRYALVYTGATLALSFLPQLFNIPAAAGVTAALPPLIGSIIEGQDHVKTHGVRASGQAAMQGAFVMTAIALAVNLLLLGAAYGASRGLVFGTGFAWGTFALWAVVLTLIQFALNRLGIRLAPSKA